MATIRKRQLKNGGNAYTVQVKLKDKVTIILCRCQKSIGCSHLRYTDNGTIYNFILGFAIQFLPSFQVFPIEKRFPILRT
mgnify:CR=1 FL=1